MIQEIHVIRGHVRYARVALPWQNAVELQCSQGRSLLQLTKQTDLVAKGHRLQDSFPQSFNLADGNDDTDSPFKVSQ